MKVLKILLKILLIILFLLVITNKALAVTEFKVTVKSSGGDYTSLSAAENGLDYTGSCDLTSTSYLTAAYDGAVGDPTGIIDAEAVTWDGGSGNIIHVTTTAKSGSNAFFIYVSSGTLEDNDVIDDDDGNTITVNGTPDTAQISIECYAMQDTTGVTIIGWTTDADHYIKVYTPTSERHNGTYDTSKYRIEVTNSIPITISEEYVKIDGLQLQLTGTDGGGERNGIYTSGTVAPSIEISNNIIVGVMSNISNSAGISIRNATATKIWNNIIYGWNYNNGVVDAGIYVHAGTLYIYNNTVRDCRQGIRGVGSPVTVKNNIVNDIAEGEWNGSFNSASTHNITDDIDALVNWGATWSTGTATSYSANKLVNSGDTFVTDGVQVGSIVRNNTDGTLGYVTAVDSETTLSLNSDLFNNGNENYTVYTNMYGEVTFENEGTNDLHLGSADTVAKDKGTDLSGDGNLPFSDDIDGESRSGTWDVGADEFDSDPPTISLTPLSPDPTNDNTPSLTGTASEAKGTVSNVQYQMDGTGGSWSNCSADDGTFDEASEDFTCTVGSALSDGSHTIYVRATDSNGNTTAGGSESTDTFTIDVTAPSISVTALSPDPNNDNTPSLTGTATDATTVLTAIQYQVDSTSGSWTTCTANDGAIDETSEAFTCTTSTLTDGSHTIYIRATDNAANTTAQANYGTDTFTIDTTDVSISLTPLSPDPTTDTTPTISGTATDTDGTISSVEYQLDSTSGSWTSCTATDGTFDEVSEAFNCSVASALSDGSHTIYVRATDSIGNTTASGSESTDTFTIDITSPPSTDLSSPPEGEYLNQERPTFKWPAFSDATSGLAKYTFKLWPVKDDLHQESDQDYQQRSNSTGFMIDDIPISRTALIGSETTLETNRYTLTYRNFNTSSTADDEILLNTHSSSLWEASNNDGKLKQGRYTWEVKAHDNAANTITSTRTFYVDFTSPSLTNLEVPEGSTSEVENTHYRTLTNLKPTIKGTLSDNFKVNKLQFSFFKQTILLGVEISRNLYSLESLHYVGDPSVAALLQDDGQALTWSFSFTPSQHLDYGKYYLELKGFDKAGNGSTPLTMNLQILTETEEEALIEEMIEEEFPGITEEEKEKLKEELKEELEITLPGEQPSQGKISSLLTRIRSFISRQFRGSFSFLSSPIYYLRETTSLGIKTLVEGLKQPRLFASRLKEWFTYSLVTFPEIVLDDQPTKISNIKVEEVGKDYAIISWETNHHTKNNKINYGEDFSYGQSAWSKDRKRHHQVKLENLKPNTLYFYEVMSHGKNYVYDAWYEFTTLAEE